MGILAVVISAGSSPLVLPYNANQMAQASTQLPTAILEMDSVLLTQIFPFFKGYFTPPPTPLQISYSVGPLRCTLLVLDLGWGAVVWL